MEECIFYSNIIFSLYCFLIKLMNHFFALQPRCGVPYNVSMHHDYSTPFSFGFYLFASRILVFFLFPHKVFTLHQKFYIICLKHHFYGIYFYFVSSFLTFSSSNCSLVCKSNHSSCQSSQFFQTLHLDI